VRLIEILGAECFAGSIPLSTWTIKIRRRTMSKTENARYKKLSAKGKTECGRDRAKDADANGGTFNAALTKLQAGYYDAMWLRRPVR
jgi:hypothetical protein